MVSADMTEGDTDRRSKRPLVCLQARHLEHAVCLATTTTLTMTLTPGTGSSVGIWAACSYLCVLAACVEEMVVFPVSQQRRQQRQQQGVYRHASNPGLVLGSCVVPWVCLVLDAHWMLACSVLASVLVLLWTVVDIAFERREQRAVTCVASSWILGWCGCQMIPHTGFAGLTALTGTIATVATFATIASMVAFFSCIRRLVPGTCTMGESIAMSCATVGVVVEASTYLVTGRSSGSSLGLDTDETGPVVGIIAAGLLAFLAALVRIKARRKRISYSYISIIVAVAAGALCLPLAVNAIKRIPIMSVLTRTDDLRLVAYWAVVLAVSLPCMMVLKRCGVRNIILRKGFHALALLLFVPPLVAIDTRDANDAPHDFRLLPLALALALVLFLMLEIVRLGNIPLPLGIGPHVHGFMASFVDSRDTQGELYVTHITLLLGLAIPIWLGSGLLMYAGIVATGVGDALASIVGSLFGCRPLAFGTRKTVEGTTACFVSMLLSWYALSAWYDVGDEGTALAVVAVVAATAVSSLLESVTESWDNVFVSVQYFCLLYSVRRCFGVGVTDPNM